MRARKLLADHQVEKPGLPIIHACRQLLVGYRDAETTGRRIEDLLTIDAYVRDGCPHCADAKRFLARMRDRYPGFSIRYHDIVSNLQARDRLMELAKRHRVQVANVPAFHLCGELIVGYDRDDTTGQRIETSLRAACIPCTNDKEPTGDERDTRRSRPEMRFPAAPPGVLLFSIPAAAAIQDSIADSSANEPLQDLPLEDIPLEDVPLEEMPAEQSSTRPATVSDEENRNIIELPFFGRTDVRRLGLPLFTILIGLVDGFNPCAMWVLLFLLSILVNLKSRRRIIAVAGTFVLISGLAYFAFMAAWLNVFLLVGFLRPAQIALGLLAVFVGSIHVKDFFAFHKGLSLSIPESAKPGIYARVRKIVNAENLTGAIFGAAVLAVLVNVVELLCTAGLPALYTQILALREFPAWKNYSYLALYNLAYMADDSLMVGLVVVTLGRRKMQEQHGRWLKLISGLAVLALGLILLFRPEWLV